LPGTTLDARPPAPYLFDRTLGDAIAGAWRDGDQRRERFGDRALRLRALVGEELELATRGSSLAASP
jgi:hypothetical protein